MKTLVLSGFMATGKTTIGRRVAERLGLPFVDTDAVIAAEGGKPVGQIFAEGGEARFRDREREVVLPLLEDGVPRVLAFGGGTVTIPAVRHRALETATVVTLTAPPETIVERAGTISERPNLGASAPVVRARDLLALRGEAYAECHAQVATDRASMEEIVERIIGIAQRDLLAMPLGSRSYAVELADAEPARLTAVLRDLAPSSLVIVTDANVRAARGAWLDAAIGPISRPSVTIELPPGEPSKTIASVQRIWDAALVAGVDRKAVVLAFGGGVVGDLAGFAASTLLRGVRCVQIATTLLSMVDSSVGGKTGFDHAAGKNLLGAFFQPAHVIIDLEHLSTLPPRERAAGLAEVVKIALVRDKPLFEELERNADAIAGGDRQVLREVVRQAVLAKIRVVRDDERESSIRALLNLGHTVGHALEAHGGYSALLHGEAVAIGTVLEIAAAERMKLSPAGTADRAAALFRRFGLPTHSTDVAAAWPFVMTDKKRMATDLLLPVVREVGDGVVERVKLLDLKSALT